MARSLDLDQKAAGTTGTVAVFQNQCKLVHKDLLAGTCPWCGSAIINGEVLKPGLSAVVSMLTTLLSHENEWVRCHAANELGRIGRDAKRAVPALTKLLSDENENIRKAASKAVEKIKREK